MRQTAQRIFQESYSLDLNLLLLRNFRYVAILWWFFFSVFCSLASTCTVVSFFRVSPYGMRCLNNKATVRKGFYFFFILLAHTSENRARKHVLFITLSEYWCVVSRQDGARLRVPTRKVSIPYRYRIEIDCDIDPSLKWAGAVWHASTARCAVCRNVDRMSVSTPTAPSSLEWWH